MDTFWYKQTKDNPAFPDTIWAKPENKSHAGMLLIIGGNQHGLSAPAEAYTESARVGIGVMRVAMPDNIKALVPKEMHLEIEFLPSIKHGSFSKKALGELIDLANWSDGVLLAGSVGRNSETSSVITRFIELYKGPIVISEDALDSQISNIDELLNRKNAVIVASSAQLQKILSGNTQTITHTDNQHSIATKLINIASIHKAGIITKLHDTIFVAYNGLVTSTPDKHDFWRVKVASRAAVWLIWDNGNIFEALSTAIIDN